PIGGARVGYIDGQYVLNPTNSQLHQSSLDLVVAGTKTAVLMVESGAKILPEEVMLGAVMFGHEQMQVAIDAIVDLAKEAGKPPIEWTPPPSDEELVAEVERVAGADLTAAYAIAQKQERHTAIAEARQRCVAALAPDESAKWTPAQVEA